VQQALPYRSVLSAIAELPGGWHRDGSPLPLKVLERIVVHLGSGPVDHSIETGTGKSTLLFSHVSQDHKVFTLKNNASFEAVVSCPILNREVVEFIDGPTQITLPRYPFANKIQVALLDGPHAYPFPDLEYYSTYSHLEEGGLLILDDINIPTIFNLFSFIEKDAMFELIDIVGITAFFRRTAAPTFSPLEDHWWTQSYNIERFPVSRFPRWGSLLGRVRQSVPAPVRRRLIRALPSGAKARLSRLMVPEHLLGN
jgi:hypothetical protein